MTKELYKTIKGTTDVSIRNAAGQLIVLPTASGSMLNPGIKVQEVTATSRLGEIVIVDTYPMERKPELKLEWTQKNLQLLGMRLGFQWEEAAGLPVNLVNNGMLVTKESYSAVAAGVEGSGMLADQTTSIAYLVSDGEPEPLTRQPFATFAAETPKSFAQGADGATKWSTDLIGQYVGFDFPYDIATGGMLLGDLENTQFSITCMTIMTDRTILQWDFPSVTVKLDQGDINLSEPKMDMTFYIQDDGSSCVPYTVKYKGKAQRRRCVAA